MLNCLVVISLKAQQREIIKPLGLPVSLSGNFGELRATHFHAGVDFRTGGREGVPVLCVKDGYVARVRVSPVGYGQALYMEHPDGTTTVYGHLQRYNDRIGQAVCMRQYQLSSFELDEDMREQELFFKQGDTIAFSGNTGSSGGPHLHFEVRDTKTEKLINPLHFYDIKDALPPVVKGVYLYQISELGCVGRMAMRQVKQSAAGQYVCAGVTIPAGKVGVAVWAEDFMNNSQSKLGIYKLEVRVADSLITLMVVDTLVFEQSCFINEIKDFDRYKQRQTVYRCFGNYLNRVAGVWSEDKGYIEVPEGKSVQVKVTLSDINGNRSVLKITLTGGKRSEKVENPEDVWQYRKAYNLEIPGCQLAIDTNSLLYSVKNVFRVERDSVRRRDVFVVGEGEIPLQSKIKLSLRGRYDQKTVICETDGKSGLYPLKTGRDSLGIFAYIGCLGKYTAVKDTEAPKITYLGMSDDRKLKFRIKDDLSGITAYGVEVNGKWCLHVYDAKTATLSCSADEPVFIKGEKNEVKVWVEDRVGNEREIQLDI